MDDFELYLDTADIDAIKDLDGLLNVQGVTTNPSILAKSGKDPLEALGQIIDYFRPDQKIFAQVVSTDFDGIVEEAHFIAGLRPQNMYVKIPVTHNGLRAIKALEAEGVHCLATSIYSADAGFMAAHNGAEYLAPYVNRMCNYGDGVQWVRELQTMLELNQLPSKICAASFKNGNQVHELMLAGVGAVTVAPDVVRAMLDHPGTKVAVEEFTSAWEAAFGRRTFA